MTMDSPSILAGPGALLACSPVLGLRDGSYGQEISYIRILSKQGSVLKLSGKPGFLLLEKGVTNTEK